VEVGSTLFHRVECFADRSRSRQCCCVLPAEGGCEGQKVGVAGRGEQWCESVRVKQLDDL
jgi:hypothetical protein